MRVDMERYFSGFHLAVQPTLYRKWPSIMIRGQPLVSAATPVDPRHRTSKKKKKKGKHVLR